MKTNPTPENPLISPSLLEQVQAMAAVEHRPASEILRDAIESYQRDHHGAVELAEEKPSAAPRSPQQAVARILERRQYRNLPEGMTIRDLMTLGRA
jgi:predicted transcriptional regulator